VHDHGDTDEEEREDRHVGEHERGLDLLHWAKEERGRHESRCGTETLRSEAHS
jgi:hypothetical protein